MSETSWYRLSLGDGVWAPQAISELEQSFLDFFEAAGQPKEMAVFSRPSPRVDCSARSWPTSPRRRVSLRATVEPSCARRPRRRASR